jgi:hypothetical protein
MWVVEDGSGSLAQGSSGVVISKAVVFCGGTFAEGDDLGVKAVRVSMSPGDSVLTAADDFAFC